MSTPILFGVLSKKLEQKRKEHPSFRLMEIDNRLFPNAQTKHSTLVLEVRNSNDELKTVAEIVAESWKKGDKNHLVIEGEGGIGKTVTLLSIPDKFTPFPVPSIYIPLHEAKGEFVTIEKYIRKRILSDKEDLYGQLLDLIDKPWDNGPQLMLLLDGFNEIAAENRQCISEDIKYWSEFPGIQIITSSRYDIHTYVSLSYYYSTIKLQPLSNRTVEEYLNSAGIPIPVDIAVKKLITIPLLLTLYVKTGLIQKQRETDSSSFREVKNAGSIVWNYLQCELWRFGKEDENAKNAIIAMEFIAPYIAWRMQQNSLFVLNKKEFHKFLDDAYRLLESHYNKPNDFPFHIQDVLQKAAGIPLLETIRNLLEKHLCLFIKIEEQYKLMHQQFRDVLAAIHLINLSYLSDSTLPEAWNSITDHYVMQFIVDLISEEEATRLWEQNRNTTPAIENATRNQLRLQGLLHDNDFSHLNFSGLDLSNISLYPYRHNNATIKLPIQPETMDKTKLSDKTFSAEGHNGAVYAVTVTPNGKFIISGAADHTIRVWDIETGKLVRTLNGHKSVVVAIAITPNGKRIVSGSADNTIRVWDVETGEMIGNPINEYCGHAIFITPNGKFIIGSKNRTICIWDLETAKLIRVLEGHNDFVTAVAVTPNERFVVSGSEDGTIRLWDLETNAPAKILEGNEGFIDSVAITPNGKFIVCGVHKSILIRDFKTGEVIRTLTGHKSYGITLAITSNGRHIISGSQDCTIRIWDMETGNNLKTMDGYGGLYDYITSVALTPNEKLIISGSFDSGIRIWDLETGELIKTLRGHNNSVNSTVVTPNGKSFVSGSNDGIIRIWDLETCKIKKVWKGHKYSVNSVAVTPNGKFIISGSSDCTIRIWNSETGKLIRAQKGFIDYGFSMSIIDGEPEKSVKAIASNGKTIVGKTKDDRIGIWDFETGEPIMTKIKTGKPKKIKKVYIGWNHAFVTPNGKYVVGSGSKGGIDVWDMENFKIIGTLNGCSDWARDVNVTPNEEFIIGTSYAGAIRIWDLKTGKLIKVLEGHKGFIDSVTVTPNGAFVVSGSRDATIRIWDIKTGLQIGEPIERHKSVNSISVTMDSKCIISSASDGTIYITDIETRETQTIYILPLLVIGLNFSKASISTPELKEQLRQNGAIV